ncbi:MAG: hypothetical protein Q8935_06265 [Bacillota bacterium]|nr:hypothetical protein [Bacillota bacterium]
MSQMEYSLKLRQTSHPFRMEDFLQKLVFFQGFIGSDEERV